jgi:hypothetical protein
VSTGLIRTTLKSRFHASMEEASSSIGYIFDNQDLAKSVPPRCRAPLEYLHRP